MLDTIYTPFGSDLELRSLARRLNGELVTPNDPDYDQARAVWNGRVSCLPAAIVRAADEADVVTAVDFARDRGMALAVRGGGHHPAGFAAVDNGLVLDVSALKSLEIDATNRTARAGAGLTAEELLLPLYEQGLIVTIGSHGTVGIAGITLGGGFGLLAAKYGLMCDNLLSVDLVTAAGERVTASEIENPDLFWALRGGGGNFGVVTNLTYRVHPVEPTIGGIVAHPAERTADVLRYFRDVTATLPDELTIFAGIMTAPNGAAVCALMAAYVGPTERGRELLAPVKAFGPPVMDMIGPMPYTAALDMTRDLDPAGRHYAATTRDIPELTDEAIETIAAFAQTRTSPHTAILLYHHHGAMCRVPSDATAYAARSLPYRIGIYAGWDEGDAAPHLEWTQRFRSALAAHTTGTGYLNIMDDVCPSAVRSAYAGNYDRLREVKAAWDPANLFRSNANVPPAAPEVAVVEARR